MLPSIIGFNKLNHFFQTFFRHRDFVTKEKCSSKTLCGTPKNKNQKLVDMDIRNSLFHYVLFEHLHFVYILSSGTYQYNSDKHS